ncbi:hypothetical protein B0J11DRAFT_235405 [Dendryphion nanum]|uniref:Transmembrane protein n=1 Tax=Dendryphion nanum TaxID=256645 RepID=A0A9P9I7U3_9PLEO|nr:hypothetical protein B0J11DRAFT_235405 [Dendryphion nanum]
MPIVGKRDGLTCICIIVSITECGTVRVVERRVAKSSNEQCHILTDSTKTEYPFFSVVLSLFLFRFLAFFFSLSRTGAFLPPFSLLLLIFSLRGLVLNITFLFLSSFFFSWRGNGGFSSAMAFFLLHCLFDLFSFLFFSIVPIPRVGVVICPWGSFPNRRD